MVSRLAAAAVFFGRVRSSTPSVNLAADFDSSISWPSWKLRDTLPKYRSVRRMRSPSGYNCCYVR